MRWFRRRRGSRAAIEDRLGHRFSNPALLETALTHRSHAYEQSPAGEHYERLEFLGDALLGFLVSEWLYARDNDAAEGVLTRRRQSVVRTSTLARAAQELELAKAIRLGRGEERTGGRERTSLAADVFEAVLAAVYLDGGIRPCRLFVERHLRHALLRTEGSREPNDDYKTRLQETTQARLRCTPRYRIVSRQGPAHALSFDVEVEVDGRMMGRGTGSSRKQAEQNAAQEALRRMQGPGE